MELRGIKGLSEEERPREKMVAIGRSNLSKAELLAILIGSGRKDATAIEVARELLLKAGDDLNSLARMTIGDLKKVKGIGSAKAISIIAALELGRRKKYQAVKEVSQIKSSSDAYYHCSKYFEDLNHEEFRILLLNRSNKVIENKKISTGGISGTVADPRLIKKSALDAKASSIILMHNHPSGALKPSRADIQLTKKIQKASGYLDILVIDHLIFTDRAYYSFADEGLL